MKLTILQYGGDYREAWERFNSGGKANYQAQRYSVNFVESLAQQHRVSLICATTDTPYDVALPNGVRAIGAGLKPGFHPRELVPLVARSTPDRLILVTPMIPILKWAEHNRVRTLTTLADSFEQGGLRTRLRSWQLARCLNNSNVDWVGNHGIAACLSLQRIGVNPEKILPWDWPPSHKPSEYHPRSLDTQGEFKLLYVGSITKSKGVADLLGAVKRLTEHGRDFTLTLVGQDPNGDMTELAKTLGLTDIVQFAGVIANEDVPQAMRASHAVVIPSRHEYPEGLPLTIYEALAARTPIIASDHPMFRGALVNEQNALIFPAQDTGEFAEAIDRLSTNPALYSALSSNSAEAWQALQLPVTWGELITRWLSDSSESVDWLRNHRLTSGKYDKQIAVRMPQ